MGLNTVWSAKVDRIFKTKPKKDEELFLNIVSMFLYSREDDTLSTLYNELGLETFTRILGLIGGSTLELPSQEELKDIMISSLCFYYKELKKQPWPEIHKLLPFNDVNAIRYGKNIAKLEKSIIEKIKNNFEDIDSKSIDAIDEIRKFI
ncbi:MAG: hypothetical protein PF569_06450 [Candidatus Woesearchaeota archaeon]|jgi:hypothetical protein|nr:hypothetical protein [Candidatus Woesearchaeota archaeon]